MVLWKYYQLQLLFIQQKKRKHGTQQHSNLTPIRVRFSFHRTVFVNIFVFCLPDNYLLSMKGQKEILSSQFCQYSFLGANFPYSCYGLSSSVWRHVKNHWINPFATYVFDLNSAILVRFLQTLYQNECLINSFHLSARLEKSAKTRGRKSRKLFLFVLDVTILLYAKSLIGPEMNRKMNSIHSILLSMSSV